MPTHTDTNLAHPLSLLPIHLAQVRVEGRGTLPDYLPDAHKIVSCRPKVQITSRRIEREEGGTYCEVQGEVLFRVLYQAGEPREHDLLDAHTYTVPFTARAECAESVPQEHFLLCRARVQQTGGRLLSPRDSSFWAELSFETTLLFNRTLSFFGQEEPMLEMRTVPSTAASLCAVTEQSFRLHQELNLPSLLPPIDTLLDVSVSVLARPQKDMAESGAFSLSAQLVFVYRSEEEDGACRVCSFAQPLEISEVLELSEPQGSAAALCYASPLSLGAEVVADEYGLRRTVALDLSYELTAAFFSSSSLNLCTDAYSLAGEVSLTMAEAALTARALPQTLSCERSLSFSLPEGTERVENVTLGLTVLSSECRQAEAALRVRLHLGALAIGASGVHSLTLDSEEELLLPCGVLCGGEQAYVIGAQVRPLSMRSFSDSISLTAELELSLLFCERQESRFVERIELSERTEEPFCGMHFLYVQESDTLWEIARRYRISPAVLREQNGITDDACLPEVLCIFP